MSCKPWAVVALLGLAGCFLPAATTIEEVPCPDAGTKLTYDNFGQEWLGVYCQVCHGQSGDARNGAPDGYDFGTHELVVHFKARIFERAAADNTTMPPGPDKPPADGRAELTEWLSCGAP
jgi:hypothetical protein